MNKLEDIYVQVVEKYTLGGDNTFMLIKHNTKDTLMDDAITIIIM